MTKIAISPNQKFVVTAGTEGAIFIWNTPASVQRTKADSDMPEDEGNVDTMNTGGPKGRGAKK